MKKPTLLLLVFSLMLFFINVCFAEGQLFALSQPISLELYPKEYTETGVMVSNSGESTVQINSEVTGNAKDFVQIENPEITIKSHEQGYIYLSVYIPPETASGPYYGTIVVESENSKLSVPMSIRVLQQRGKILDIKVAPFIDVISPGQTLRINTTFHNLGGSGKMDVHLMLQLIDPSTSRLITEQTYRVVVETTTSKITDLNLSKDILEGRYILRGTADFICEESNCKETAISYVTVQKSFSDLTPYETPISLMSIAVPVFVVLFALVIILVFIYFLVIKKKKE